MIGTTLIFITALLIHPTIYLYTIAVAVFYYSFTYKRLNKLSFWQLVIKILKFLIILILVFMIFTVIGAVIAAALGLVGETLGT